MFVKLIYRHFVFNQEKYQVCKFRIYTHFAKSVNGSNFPGGGLLGSIYAGYVPLASQNPYPIIVYSVANYRPHLSHFWANVIFAIPT